MDLGSSTFFCIKMRMLSYGIVLLHHTFIQERSSCRLHHISLSRFNII